MKSATSRRFLAKAALALALLQFPTAFTGAGSLPPARTALRAVKEEQDVALKTSQDQSPIPLRDATEQSSVDGQFLSDLEAASAAPEVLQLLTNHRDNLRLAESVAAMEKLLKLTSPEELGELVKETVLVDVLRFQVDALQTLQLRPKLIIAMASLAMRLPDGELLLTTALQALKPKTMRMSDMKDVLSSPLSGIKDFRHEILCVMADFVHRMSPEVMVVVLETLAEYQEKNQELLDDIIERAQQKSFRMTPHEGVGLLFALARLETFNKALLVHFSSQAAVDMSPYSVEEVCQWAEILRRLNFNNKKLLNILVKVTTWRSASMSAEQVETMLRCFQHFKLSAESIRPIEDLVRAKKDKTAENDQ